MGKEEDEERAMKEVGVKEEAATASGQIPTRKSPLRFVSDRQTDTSNVDAGRIPEVRFSRRFDSGGVGSV